MNESGAVPRQTVLAVLESCSVSVKREGIDDGQDHLTVTLIKGTTVEVQDLPDVVGRRLIMRLAHKFDVPRHYFWHPEMIPENQRVPGVLTN